MWSKKILIIAFISICAVALIKVADKVYHPEEIVDTPFPGELEVTDTQSQSVAGGNFSPNTTKEKAFPKKRISTELLSTALNTRSRKVLQEFELTQSGGFQIGNFENGVSGDLRITPNGLTARDIAGLTTFAIDGTTGDAIFKGTIQAGSLLTGGVTIEDENGTTIIDGIGLVSTNNFSESSSTTVALNQLITSGTRTNITDATLNLSLGRDSIILIMADIRFYHLQSSGSGDWDAQSVINFDIDGSEKDGAIRSQGGLTGSSTDSYGSSSMTSASMHRIEEMEEGTHTIKLQSYLTSSTNNGALNIYNFKLSYIVLGN